MYKLEIQNDNIEKLYSEIAEVYDADFEEKADYKVPKILKEIFEKYKIKDSVVLDIGCGTGKLSTYLGDSFSYRGIDLSEKMLEIAKERGYQTYKGDILETLKGLDDKSVDHIVALSSLYFIDDFETFIKEAERVAKKSIFVTLEQFTESVKEIMQKRDIVITNHSIDIISNTIEEVKNVHLWTRPNTDDKIFGDIAFKLMV